MALTRAQITRRYRERHPGRVKASRRAHYKRGILKPHLSAGEKAEIRAFYRAGLTFKEIGQRLKRTGGTISRYLRSLESIRPRPMKSGPGSVGWKGGRFLSHGYVYIWIAPDDPLACMRDRAGRVAEHRLLMARGLGRPLTQSETVHHIDGDRTHNEPANLQLRQGRHGKGIAMLCLDCGSHRVGPAPLED